MYMRKTCHTLPKFRFTPQRASANTYEIKMPDTRPIGFCVVGQKAGPNLIVAGAGASVRPAYQMLLSATKIQPIKGRLFLIFLDAIEEPAAVKMIDAVANVIKPVKDILFLTRVETQPTSSVAEDCYHQILRFCARNGSPIGQPQEIRDFAN